MRRLCKFICIWILLSSTTNLFAQTFPVGFSRQLVSGSITRPSVLAFAPDGRIFVAQQSGQLRIIKNDALLPNPFISLTVNDAGERGLIGVALDPDFSNNHFIYLYYTVPGTPPHNRLSRFTADGDVVLAGSETNLLDLDPLSSATNHNGGALAFGNDGKLYIGVGDNAHSANAQNLTTYHGKILRINSDGSLPSDNPFIAAVGHAKRIWALGVRNPFSISVNKNDGKIFANDVGANSWEEINDITVGGQNFGWPQDEGISTNPDFTNPVYTYPHGSGEGVGCAITGGTFFTPSTTNYPAEYYNKYFFLDYCEDWINTIDPEENPIETSSFASAVSNFPLYLTTGTDGNLYYLSRSSSIYRIVYSNTSPPFITHHPEDAESLEGTSVTFDVNAIGSLPFSYQWKKNNVDISGATESSFLIEDIDETDAGSYSVLITNAGGNATSDAALLSVIPVVGTNEQAAESQLSLFPNPTNNEVVLRIYSARNESASIFFIDHLGKIGNQSDANLVPGITEIKLDISNLPKGVYVIRVESKNKREFKRFLKN